LVIVGHVTVIIHNQNPPADCERRSILSIQVCNFQCRLADR
jgi:hypothetical protein